MMMQKSVFIFIAFLCVVNAHSWMQCADYTEENGRYWDAANCRGWPRNYGSAYQYQNYLFGGDAGFNYQPKEDAPCQASFGTAASASYPNPSYAPGQRVCLAWPPKNHVAANCNNANIPDAGTKIKISGVNPTKDPTLSSFTTLFDFGANTKAGAGVGFQNCPDFCDKPDKALCTGCFNIPADMKEGKYVFLWEWAFNGASDLYTTCFDVTIAKSVNNKSPVVYSKMGPDEFVTAVKSTTIVSSGQLSSGSGNSGSGSSGSDTESGGKSGKSGEKTYGGGSIAAAVILTLLSISAIFIGIMFFARTYPHSAIGTHVFKFLEPSANPRREALI